MEIKGKEEPLEVYELIKDKVYRPRLGQERQIYSEMVGRDNELNELEIQILKAIKGEGSVVNVIGEAGIGKSRLISELRNSPMVKKVTLLEGRAISIGRNLSFHPIIDLLKHWARISEDDTEAMSLGKLETAIRSVSQQDADEIIPFVATLMGMKLTGRYAERVKGIEGEGLEKLILKNIRDLLTKATELTPLVVVIEDLHWADTSSIELLESLFRIAETQRILFINVFRPDHKETGERIVESLKEKLPVYYVEINLEPLTEQMSQTLIDNMLNIKGLHHGIKNKIVQRAGGNPFFIEEVVRSFIDEGAVIVEEGKFEVTDKIESMIIPHTINDVLMARIDRLEDETRDLVKVASVIGRNFFHRILSEVAKSVRDIDNRLSHLKEIQLIRERKRMEELEYLFKHALAQEAAYESILLQKRKEIHLQVAKSIERVFKERLHEFYGMLALHYSKGWDYENAEHYLVKAGEEALRSSASSEALHYYQEALTLYQKKYGDAANPAKLTMLERNIGIALYNKGQFVEAIENIVKVLEYYGEKLPKHSMALKLKFLLCFIEFVFGLYFPFLKFKRSPTPKDIDYIYLYFLKLQCLTQIDPVRFFIESFYLSKRFVKFDLTKIEYGIGMFSCYCISLTFTGISFSLSRKVLDFCKDKINKDDIKTTLCYELSSIVHKYYKGEWHKVKKLDDKLVNNNLDIGEIFVTSSYVMFHGMISINEGRFTDSQRIIGKMSEISNTYENDIAKSYKNEQNIMLMITSMKFHSLMNDIEEGITFAKKIEKKFSINYFYTIKARIQILLKDIEGAEESMLRANGYLSDIKDIPYYHSAFLLSQFIRDLYRLEEAIQSGKKSAITSNRKKAFVTGNKSVKISKKSASDRTQILKLMGRYYWLIGKQSKAFKWWGKAVKKGERLGARPDLSRTYFEIGKALLDPKCNYKEWIGISAQEYFNKARTMFEDMDLQYDLDELDKIAASN